MNKREKDFIETNLQSLKRERDRREPLGWEDYDWCVREGDFNEGQISILESLLELNSSQTKHNGKVRQ